MSEHLRRSDGTFPVRDGWCAGHGDADMRRAPDGSLFCAACTPVVAWVPPSASQRIAELESLVSQMRAALKDIRDGYDHEEQTHDHQPFKYGGTCRVCLAERTLAAPASDGERTP